MAKVFISASDQKSNVYAYGNTNEAVQCSQIAHLLDDFLCKNGVVSYVGTGDMYNRVSQSNSKNPDLHIAIHTNAYNGKVMGTRVFYYDMKESYSFARAVYDSLAPVTIGDSDNITQNQELYEMQATLAPAVYCECEFHDSLTGAKFIIDNKREIAEAIGRGILKVFGISEKTNDESGKLYKVQVGAFKNKQNAESFLEDVKKTYRDAFIIESEE